MKEKFRADHIGSLKRPAALLEEVHRIYQSGHTAMLAEERKKDLARLHEREDEAIRRVVKHQEEIGLHLVTDGEFRRLMYFNSFYDAVEGIEPSKTKLRFRADDGTVTEHDGPVAITGRLRKIDSPASREVKFLSGLTKRDKKVTFPCASFVLGQVMSSPMALQAYNSPAEAAEATIEILRELVMDAVAAGATYIQFDESAYLFVATSLFDDIAKGGVSGVMDERRMGLDREFLKRKMLEADARVIQGLPGHVTTCMHNCRGNYGSRYLSENDHMAELDEAFFALPYDRFTFEWDDHVERGEKDYQALERVPRGGPVIVLGVVSTRHPQMEEPEEIIAKVQRAARHIPLEQLAISPQCGFASAISPDGKGPDGNLIDEDVQWRKLELLVNTARKLWGET